MTERPLCGQALYCAVGRRPCCSGQRLVTYQRREQVCSKFSLLGKTLDFVVGCLKYFVSLRFDVCEMMRKNRGMTRFCRTWWIFSREFRDPVGATRQQLLLGPIKRSCCCIRTTNERVQYHTVRTVLYVSVFGPLNVRKCLYIPVHPVGTLRFCTMAHREINTE